MAKNVTIDASQIIEFFNNLNQDKQKEIMLKALKNGATYLKEETQKTLSSKFPKAQSTKGKAKKTMYEGIYTKANKDLTEVKVSVMGNYLNIFFEGGTDKRYLKKEHKPTSESKLKRTLKKGEYRGEIKPLNFFQETRKRESDNVIKKIEDIIGKELDKLNK